MKKISVIVKDKTTLELAEDANKGDYIDLTEVVQVDTEILERLIDSNRDVVYQKKLKEALDLQEAENKIKLGELNAKIDSLNESNKQALVIKEQEIDSKYNEKIAELNAIIEKNKLEKETALLEADSKKHEELNSQKEKEQEKYNILSQEYEKLKAKYESDISKTKAELEKEWSNKVGKLENEKITIKSENDSDIKELKAQIEKLKLENEKALKEADSNLKLQLANQKSDEDAKYNGLSQKYEALLAKYQSDIDKAKAETKTEWSERVNKLEAEKEVIKTQNEANVSSLNTKHELEINKALNDQKDAYEAKLLEKENQINQLQRAKASLNVKQTGEDLESWCDNEVSSYMENGFSNCKWEKDNKVVKEDGEEKGSKADYIFRIYESDKFERELASICMDMKDENPDSKNKKSNSDYYKQLDKNREKKQCKYALLVSNLELDKPNDLPIYRVKEYKDMYVVRPAYLMTFLNMITSLTQKYADIIKASEKEVIELQEKQSIIDEFDKIKNTYLDKPLKLLSDDIADILKKSKTIKDASKAIDEACDDITRRYINEIEAKIERFDVAINRLSKKI